MRKYSLKHAQMIYTFHTKNNIAQLYFILGRAELRWNFFLKHTEFIEVNHFSSFNSALGFKLIV